MRQPKTKVWNSILKRLFARKPGPVRWKATFVFAGSYAVTCALLSAQGDGALDLGRQVAALFKEHCASCHTSGSKSLGGVTYKGDFESVLDFDQLRSGPYLDLAHPDKSELYELVATGEMPHHKVVQSGLARELDEKEVATVLAWIEAGAPGPTDPSEVGSGFNGLGHDTTGAEPNLDWSRGEELFQVACTACHPASRALRKSKTYEGWLKTVERMARKPEAHVRKSDFGVIAGFLANRPSEGIATLEVKKSPGQDLFDALSLNGTFSTSWVGSADDDRLENQDFTLEAWVTMAWHPEGSALSARVTACTTCHSDFRPESRGIEIAEAALRLDLGKAARGEESSIDSYIEAGRFIVPFGGFSGRSNPAAYRTVSRPLLYNMGQMADRSSIGPAVLPMPYSDEGVNFKVGANLSSDLSVDFDAYAVNGLQGTLDVDFWNSRSYSDNNGQTAVGGRFVLSAPNISLGLSGMTGRLDDESGGVAGKLDYHIVGIDVAARLGKRFRLLAEVARRQNDRATFMPADPIINVRTEGLLLEGNYLLLEESDVSLVARYDTLHYNGSLPPLMSSLSDDDFQARRFTWGFEFGLSGGSTLMLNHEHWSMPGDLESIDVVGVRWAGSF